MSYYPNARPWEPNSHGLVLSRPFRSRFPLGSEVGQKNSDTMKNSQKSAGFPDFCGKSGGFWSWMRDSNSRPHDYELASE